MKTNAKANIYTTFSCVVCTILVTLLFPSSFWFFRILCGIAAGTAIILVFRFKFLDKDVIQHFDNSPNRWQRILFAAVALGFLIPHFTAENQMLNKLRTLVPHEVKAVHLEDLTLDAPVPRPVSKELKDELLTKFRDSALYHRVNRTDDVCHIYIELSNGEKLKYHALIPENQTESLSLAFQAFKMQSHVIVPNARNWLDRALLDQKRAPQ